MQEVEYKLRTGIIGVVSDTHVPARAFSLPHNLFNALQEAELILHAGDLEEENVLMELAALAPVEAVAGNMDPLNLKKKLGTEKIIRLGEVSLGLTHGSGMPRGMPEPALRKFKGRKIQGLIFGHSHVPFLEYRQGILILNPGSVGDPRWGSKSSCARLIIEGKHIRAEIIEL